MILQAQISCEYRKNTWVKVRLGVINCLDLCHWIGDLRLAQAAEREEQHLKTAT